VDLMEYLKRAVADKASDLFIVAGGPVSEKLEKRISSISAERIFPRETEELIRQVYDLAKRPMDRYMEEGDDDFSFSVPSLARFRVNVYRQRGSMAAVIRVVAFDIPHWRDLSIPEGVMDLAEVQHGMVLVTGTAGSGKSTTQACIIDQINRSRECHIITLEDPIEYLHRDRRSIISQREMSIDTIDYPSALRALAESVEQRQALEAQAEANAPKVLFADAVAASHTSILVGELAKLLKQNGVNIGQRRLFDWLRKNGYLIRRSSSDYNMPSQRAMELGLFEIKEASVATPDGVRVTKTPKVTGKGQQYFVDLFLRKKGVSPCPAHV